MTEMSTRERVAAADKEAAREAYEAHKEQERSWRSKAIAREEAEAASRTGGSLAGESGHSERKQLGINVGAADSYPRKTRGVQIERPYHEGSNALTGTALGDKIGATYAPPMEGVEGFGAAQPLAGQVQESDDTTTDTTSKANEDNNASKQSLTGDVQQTNAVAAGHSSTTVETQSDNPLLNMNDEDLANGLNTELSMLQQVKVVGKADGAWDRRVLWVYSSWQEWIACGNTLNGHFDKLKPMVESMFATFKTRCGKRKAGLPANNLDDIIAIVSVVRDDMNGALRSVTTEQSASEVQSPNDEQLSHDQKQIAQHRESAEILEHQLLQQDAQILNDHELAKSLDQQQQQQQPKQPLHQQTYIQGDIVDQETGTRKQKYPQPVIASGSGTYPRKDWASQRIDIQVPNSPWIRPTWLPNLKEGPPTHKVVTLASEQFAQGCDYTPAGDNMIVHTAQINTGQSNTSVEDVTIALEEQSNTDPVNTPLDTLLEQSPSKAWKMLDSWLDEADSTFRTLTRDEAEAWFQGLNVVFACWSHWITHGNNEIWGHVEGCRVIQLANIAFGAHDLIQGQSLPVTDDVIHVCKRMAEMKNLAENEERARIKEEAEQESSRMAETQQQQQMQQQQQQRMQQLVQKRAVEKDGEQARREPMGMAQTQSQQRPHTPPAVEMEEDLYGLSPGYKAQLEAKKSAQAKTVSNATSANETKPEFVPATDDEIDASLREAMASDGTLSDSGVQQHQHVGAPSQPHQQAPPAIFSNVDPVPVTARSTQAEPQANIANVMALETKPISQDEMDTAESDAESPKVRLDVQKVDLQTNQFSFAVNGTHQDAFNKNLKAENAARKSAADRIALKDGWRVDSGNDEALFVSDDVQKRHQDDLREAQAKAEADVAAAHKADDEARPRSGSDSSLTSFELSGDEDNTRPKPTTALPQASSSNTTLNFSTGPPTVQQIPAPGSDEDDAKYRREQAAKCFPPNVKF